MSGALGPVRLLLADDHRMVREAFARSLDAMDGFTVVAQAENGLEAIEMAAAHKPDVALFDVSMPMLNGIEAARRACAAAPALGILVVSVEADEDTVVRALEAGARGYILKSCNLDDLERAVRTVARGETYLHSSVAEVTLRRMMGGRPGSGNDRPSLSPRQREVLQLIAEGYATKEIAHMLALSPKTVETHRAELMDRLGARGVADLVRHAIRIGLIKPDR